MYKYGPNKSVLRVFDKHVRGWCRHLPYDAFVRILKDHGVSMKYRNNWDEFADHYRGVCYFSKERRRQVPINGVLFPVSLFEEEIV